MNEWGGGMTDDTTSPPATSLAVTEKSQSGFRGAGARRWTAAEDELLAEGRALGFTFSELVILLGRDVTPGAIQMRLNALRQRAAAVVEAERVAARVKMRRCMRCTIEFPSPHAGVRLCDGCRAFASDLSPLAPAWAADDEDDVEAADGPSVVGLPLIARASSKPRGRATASAHRQPKPTGGVEVRSVSGAPAAPGTNFHHDHPAFEKSRDVNQRLSHA
jgi:hypothetical protein